MAVTRRLLHGTVPQLLFRSCSQPIKAWSIPHYFHMEVAQSCPRARPCGVQSCALIISIRRSVAS